MPNFSGIKVILTIDIELSCHPLHPVRARLCQERRLIACPCFVIFEHNVFNYFILIIIKVDAIKLFLKYFYTKYILKNIKLGHIDVLNKNKNLSTFFIYLLYFYRDPLKSSN